MKFLRLTMPYIDLSFTVIPEKRLEKRILTPFGLCDVVVKTVGPKNGDVLKYEVSVDGDLASWLYDLSLKTPGFRQAVKDFVHQLVVEDLLRVFPLSEGKVCELEIKGCDASICVRDEPCFPSDELSIEDG
ncbi:hypothetical protein [Thermodesulforhabdus norvegica]|uniref:Uncharacterized protein n=1 Tax=Thermodesulforhabdus norvegica TaxID=39841 RepID=A0A1I4UZ49_9BACT|nr:hypothetical protein [Thermodesulforhabdus norvegica]SFM94201.1 hypothetical protein SAMN05660836_02053 [Thermodesulforhabdus norvegica]